MPPAKRKCTETPTVDLGTMAPNCGTPPPPPISLEPGNVAPGSLLPPSPSPSPSPPPPVSISQSTACGHSPPPILSSVEPASGTGTGFFHSVLSMPPETSFTPASISPSLPPCTDSSNYTPSVSITETTASGRSPLLVSASVEPASRTGTSISPSLSPLPPETSFTPSSTSPSLPPWINSSNYSGTSSSLHLPHFWQYQPPENVSEFGGSTYSRESGFLVSTIMHVYVKCVVSN